jgi:formylglycine-generating enzyme required for sulfatase activity
MDDHYLNEVATYNILDESYTAIATMSFNSLNMSLNFPFLVYISIFETPMYAPMVYSLEDNSLRKISDFHLPHDAFHHDGRHIAISGDPWESGAAYGYYRTGVWAADLADLDFRPIAVLDDASSFNPYVEGDYIIFVTSREALRTSTHDWQSYEIYLFDRKYKRERPLTDTPDLNEHGPAIEYPYVGWFVEDGPSFYAGPHQFTHLETGETWSWSSRTNDVSRIENRLVYNEMAQAAIDVYRLPDAPHPPDMDDCDDGNPCTDEHFWVTTAACHAEPNHDRCDDDDPDTLFDMCIDSHCTGLALGEDDAPMVDIPAGGFWWGNDGPPQTDIGDYEIGQAYEGPKRFETLAAFSIDRHEVTTAQYARCVAAGACAAPVRNRAGQIQDYTGNPDYADWPVVYVNWYEARNYCEWVGKRLPTEAEWSKAARGDADERWYPWGDVLPYNGRKANLNYDFPEMDDSDVAACGSYPEDVSPYGVYDLSGNVAEWTASAWTPTGLDGAAQWGDELMVTKGGNWLQQPFFSGWVDDRNPSTPWSAAMFIGFRCVK